MALTGGLRGLMGVFGPMLSAARAGGRGVANMWSAYQAAYESLGLDRPNTTLYDMNTFRGFLGRIMQSAANLGRAADTDAITSDHWTTPLGYETNPTDQAAPSMLVTYLARIDTGEQEVEQWSTLVYHSRFPATVGELRSDATMTRQTDLDLAAMEEGTESPTAGGNVVGISDMYITARGL